MQAQDIEHIAVLDDTPPSFDEESVVIENGTLTITFSGCLNYNIATPPVHTELPLNLHYSLEHLKK